MTSFNKATIKTIRNDINDALAKVAKQHGITLDIGNIRYSEAQFTTKLTATAAETKSDAAQVEWNANAYRFGLEDSNFGQTINVQGKALTICGIKTRNRKYPILARDNRTNVYKLPVRMVVQALQA